MNMRAAFVVAATAAVLAGTNLAAQDRAPDPRRHGPVVADVSSPFFADGSVRIEHDQRRFFAAVLTKTGRVPAAWPLVIRASITLDGDVLKSTFDGLSCAPAIDGHLGVATPMPQPPVSDTAINPLAGDAVGAPRQTPMFPDLRWGGTFAAGPIPAGVHTFTLVCSSASPFELRGEAMLNVTGNPSARGDRADR